MGNEPSHIKTKFKPQTFSLLIYDTYMKDKEINISYKPEQIKGYKAG